MFTFPKKVSAQVIFSENFDDNNASGWIVPRDTCSSDWQVVSNKYGITTNSCITETIPDTLIIDDGASYSFEVDMTMPSSLNDRNFVFKYLDANNWYGIHTYHNAVYVQKVVGGTEYILSNRQTNFDFVTGGTYSFRVDVINNNFYRVYINGILQNTVFDQLPFFNNYSAGLQASGNSQVWFDNVIVTQILAETPSPSPSPSPSPTPSPTPIPTTTPSPTPVIPILNVDDLKQYSTPWDDDLYDHTLETIKQWGCALTSASMILKYHGHNILPDTLNNWLNLRPDGYIRNGLINWLAVSKYTKDHYSPTSRTLEYKRLSPSEINLDNELTNNRPAILKEDGHFVVATGKLTDTYTINDPGYSDRPTLDSYGNNYLAINSYTPTDSDLSYMMFVADSDIVFELVDSDGNPVSTTQEFIEEPINDIDDSLNKSGDPLSVLLFEKPESGEYKLRVSGVIGSYELDTYLYDINGLVTQNTFDGQLLGGDTDIYNISFDPTNNIDLSVDGILKNIDNAFDNNLIKNKGIYQSIKVHLRIYERFQSIKIIELLIKQIKILTPKLINSNFSSVLQQNLQNLIH